MKMSRWQWFAFYWQLAIGFINLLLAWHSGTSWLNAPAAAVALTYAVWMYHRSRRIEPVQIEPWADFHGLAYRCTTHDTYFCGCPEPLATQMNVGFGQLIELRQVFKDLYPKP